jgi:hypothetical protein
MSATVSAPAPSAPAVATAAAASRPVSLVDLDVPFGRLMFFFIKAGLAAIPALFIVMVTVAVAGGLLRGLFRIGFWGLHGGPGW